MLEKIIGSKEKIIACVLAMTVMLQASACNIKGGHLQNDETKYETSVSETSAPPVITSETTTESTTETTTETTVPEPQDVTGIYLMMYKNPGGDDIPSGVRMELLREDDNIAVLFQALYIAEGSYSSSYVVDPIGPYVVAPQKDGNLITCEREGEKDTFKVVTDGKTADVTFSIFGVSDESGPVQFSGHYERIYIEEPKSDEVPAATNDPATPGGAIDSVIATEARKQLGLPEGEVLTAENLKNVYSLDLVYAPSLNGIEFFTNLSRISIQLSCIKDISPLADLVKLREIYISDSPVDTIPDLSRCKDLKNLTIVMCDITDLTPVTTISSLKELNMGGNKITSVAPIKDLDSLEILNIADNPITDWELIKDNKALTSAMETDYDLVLKVLNKARSLVNKTITDDMSDLDKEIAIYKMIHKIADQGYPERKKNAFAYSVLMEGEGVCIDFAEAVSLLMTLAGLECWMTGSSTHEWNVIKIDGKYYEIDCMWDDYLPVLNWKYFNLSRGRMDEVPEHHVKWPHYTTEPCSMPALQYLRQLNIVSEIP